MIKKIVGLLALISPLMPFSSYHIAKQNNLQWPIIHDHKFYEGILKHNSMIKIRVSLQNKLKLNRLSHSTLYVPSLKDDFS